MSWQKLGSKDIGVAIACSYATEALAASESRQDQLRWLKTLQACGQQTMPTGIICCLN
jgi:hypothetical protein